MNNQHQHELFQVLAKDQNYLMIEKMTANLTSALEHIEIQLWDTIYNKLKESYRPYIYLNDDRLQGALRALTALVGKGNYSKNYGIEYELHDLSEFRIKLFACFNIYHGISVGYYFRDYKLEFIKLTELPFTHNLSEIINPKCKTNLESDGWLKYLPWELLDDPRFEFMFKRKLESEGTRLLIEAYANKSDFNIVRDMTSNMIKFNSIVAQQFKVLSQ